MPYNYIRAKEIAARAILKYGEAGQVTLKGSSGGFDDSGDATPDTPDTVINGIITPLVAYTTREIDDKTILNGDSWVYFDSETEIEVNMQTTLNGVTFRIVKVFKLSSVDDIVIYRKLTLRV